MSDHLRLPQGDYFSMAPPASKHQHSASTYSTSTTSSTSSGASTPSSIYSIAMPGSVSSTSSVHTHATSYSVSSIAPKRVSTRPVCQQTQLDSNGQPVDILARDYPKPVGEVSIEEALATPPLPGTFRYGHGVTRTGAKKVMTMQQKRDDMERVKAEMRAEWGLGKGGERRKDCDGQTRGLFLYTFSVNRLLTPLLRKDSICIEISMRSSQHRREF